MWQIKYIKDKYNLKSGCGRKIAHVIERQNDQILVIGLPVHERLQGWSYETKKKDIDIVYFTTRSSGLSVLDQGEELCVRR